MAGLHYTDELPFKEVLHHETDSEKHKSFLERMTEQHTVIAEKASQVAAVKSLRAWEKSVPSRYSTANLDTIVGSDVDKIKGIVEARKATTPSFYIYGERQSSKTYIAYAIIREYVLSGQLRRNEIMVFSQEDLELWSQSGFKGKDLINELFNQKYKFYLVENIDVESSKLWDLFISHIYNNSLNVIFTSEKSPKELCKVYSQGTVSRLNRIINGNVVKTNVYDREGAF